jgi:hypothetical protein
MVAGSASIALGASASSGHMMIPLNIVHFGGLLFDATSLESAPAHFGGGVIGVHPTAPKGFFEVCRNMIWNLGSDIVARLGAEIDYRIIDEA